MSEHSGNRPMSSASANKKAEKQPLTNSESLFQKPCCDLTETANASGSMALCNRQIFVQQHPLLTPVVLKVMFNCLFALEDLQKLRLVCRCWYEASLKQWRSHATVNLGPEDTDTSQQLQIFKYLEYLKSSNDFYRFAQYPFQQYIIQRMHFEPTRLSNNSINKMSDSCWNLIGPLMKTVHFQDCNFGHLKTLQNVLIKKLVNLKSLSVYDPERPSAVPESGYYQACCKSWKSRAQNLTLTHLKLFAQPIPYLLTLLFSAPNVKVLTIFSEEHCDWPRLYAVLAQVASAKFDVDHEQFKIQELNLNLNITQINDSVLLRRRMRLPVERVFFSLQIPSPNENVCFRTGFYNLRTLESLELCRLFRHGTISCHLRNGLASLKKLYLYNFCFSSLKVLGFLPNLETFYVDTKMYDSLDRVLEATDKPTMANALGLPKFKFSKNIITDLTSGLLQMQLAMKLFHVDQELHVDSWRIVKEWMPNLETVETVLGPVSFQCVCRHLPNLKGLMLLHGSKIDDEVLTGVTEADRNPDNITAFTQLESFQVQRFCGKPNFRAPPNCRLGDQSVYEGFFEMTYLENVSIHASQNMTGEAEELLRKHVPNVQVIRSYIKSRSNHTSECCKVKDFLMRCPPQYY